MFATPAFAQTAGAAPGGTEMLMQFLPLILIFVIFYFLLIRPQQKRAKEHKAMLDALRRGDQILTAGGLHAKITKVADDHLEAEIAPSVKVRIARNTVASVLSRTEPANDN